MATLPSRSDLRLAGPPAFLLGLVLMAYMLLETARDALFLSGMPAERLPFVYIVIALAALVISQVERLSRSVLSGRVALAITLVASSAGTAAFWFADVSRSSWMLGALYSYSGIIITVIMLQFWMVLSARFAASQAKRLFPIVAAGSTAGALAGSALATAITRMASTPALLLAASGGLLLAVLLLPFFPTTRHEQDDGQPDRSMLQMLRGVFRSPYAVRLGLTLVTASVVLTMLDYVFKAAVTEHIAPGDLGDFFSKFYLALNLCSLFIQVVLARWLVDRLGVLGVALVMPVCLLFGALGAAVLGSFTAVLGMKAVDGSLRHTLHRTSQELMFVPLPDRVRDVLKPLADTLGHRGGQAVASVILLGITAAGGHWRTTSVLLAVLFVAWAVQVISLRRSYLQVFQDSLTVLASDVDLDFLALDGSSTIELVDALDSEDDGEAMTALAVLRREGRFHHVPSLMVFHRSEAVAERVLRWARQDGDDRVVEPAVRRMASASPRLQAAIVLAVATLDPSSPWLSTWRGDRRLPAAQVVIAALRHAQDLASSEQVNTAFESALDELPTPVAWTAVARALSVAGDEVVEAWVGRVFDEAPLDARRFALLALEGRDSIPLMDALLGALTDSSLREAACAIAARWEPALDRTHELLVDPDHPLSVRRQLPQVLAASQDPNAVPALYEVLASQADGLLRYNALRALEKVLAEHPDHAPATVVRHEVLEREVRAALRALWLQLSLEQTAPEAPCELRQELCRYLHDSRVHRSERVIRLLGLGHPTVRIDRLFYGLRSDEGRVWSAAHQLLDREVPPTLRDRVMALVEQGPADERLAAVVDSEPGLSTLEDERAVLAACLQESSRMVRTLAAALAAQRGIHSLADDVLAIELHDADALLIDLLAQAKQAMRREAV